MKSGRLARVVAGVLALVVIGLYAVPAQTQGVTLLPVALSRAHSSHWSPLPTPTQWASPLVTPTQPLEPSPTPTLPPMPSPTPTRQPAASPTPTDVLPVNHPPMAMDDILEANKNSGPVVLDVLANDWDEDGDTLTITSVTVAAHGTVAMVVGGDSVVYMPARDFVEIDWFTYRVTDGKDEAEATVVIRVAGGRESYLPFVPRAW